jgi:hypothetical protein
MEDDSTTNSSLYTTSEEDSANLELDPDEELVPALAAPTPWKPKIKYSYKWDTQENYCRIEDSLASIIRPADIPY